MPEAIISVDDDTLAFSLLGARDKNLSQIQEALKVQIHYRNDQIKVVAADDAAVQQAVSVVQKLLTVSERRDVTNKDVTKALHSVTGKNYSTKLVKPRTPGQAAYLQTIENHDLVFAVGPAGTGKTFLAVAMAVEALNARKVKKIVLVRPAVEAGENLGFLPGDLNAKIDPYLRPLFDSLQMLMKPEEFKDLLTKNVIEIAPLAYMRGRTLNDAYIILDEGQNATVVQMKMFLTRMGENSKVIVSGDTSQIDLPLRVTSGLADAIERLQGLDGVAVARLTGADVVRHKLVREIVAAYDKPE